MKTQFRSGFQRNNINFDIHRKVNNTVDSVDWIALYIADHIRLALWMVIIGIPSELLDNFFSTHMNVFTLDQLNKSMKKQKG